MSNNQRLHLYRQATIDGVLNQNGGLPPLSVSDSYIEAAYCESTDEIITSDFSQNISGSEFWIVEKSDRNAGISVLSAYVILNPERTYNAGIILVVTSYACILVLN